MKSMKRYIAFLLALSMMLSLAGCKGKEKEEGTTASQTTAAQQTTSATEKPTESEAAQPTEIDLLRDDMMSTGYIAAVAYLGYYDGDHFGLDGYLDEYVDIDSCSFTVDIDKDHYVAHEGGELYYIVPCDANAEVTVYTWIVDESNDYEGEPGDVLYHSNKGDPIIVRGNVSEIVPNFMVEIIVSEGWAIEYTPSLSGMNGMLVIPYEGESVFDITPYENLGYDFSFDKSLLFTTEYWETGAYISFDEELTGSLSFREDGTMSFMYGDPDDIYTVFYEGSYYPSEYTSHPEDTYILELYLVENNYEYMVAEQIRTAVRFSNEPARMYIDMDYIEGDSLFGYENITYYCLTPTVG